MRVWQEKKSPKLKCKHICDHISYHHVILNTTLRKLSTKCYYLILLIKKQNETCVPSSFRAKWAHRSLLHNPPSFNTVNNHLKFTILSSFTLPNPCYGLLCFIIIVTSSVRAGIDSQHPSNLSPPTQPPVSSLRFHIPHGSS